MRSTCHRLATGLLASLCLLTLPARAQDGARGACVAAYEANQKLRNEGKLTAARAELLVCTQQACPDFVRPDCIRWLSEVDAQMPSIVIAAKDPRGLDTPAVTVFIDGNKVAEGLDGRPIPLDPGTHQLRLEHAGSPPVEQQLLIQQGVKNRLIDVSFAGTSPPPQAMPVGPPEPLDEGRGQSVQSVMSYVFFGLSVPAWVTFAVFGIQGKNRADELNSGCGATEPSTCTEEEVGDAEQKLLIADISLGVGAGLTALGVGFLIWHFVRDPEPGSAAAGVSVSGAPTAGGAMGQLTVRF